MMSQTSGVDHLDLVSLFGRPIVLVFFVGQKKIVLSQRLDIFFVHSLEFFVQCFLKIGHSLISRMDKRE